MPKKAVGIVFAVLATGALAEEPERVYLKKTGDGWVEVKQDRSGTLHLSSPAMRPQAPLRQLAASSSAGLFKGHVAYPTGSFPEAVAIGDVNGDGLNDVVLTTSFYFDPASDHMIHVFHQDGSGDLGPAVKYAAGNRPQSVDIGDVNGDGRQDVVVASSGVGVGVFLQNADGTLDARRDYATPADLRVRIADLNGDGRQDVVAIGWGGTRVDVLLQNDAGTLDDPITYSAPHHGYDDLEIGDLDSDGRADVVVMSGQLHASPDIHVLSQQLDGTLGPAVPHEVPGTFLARGVAVGDVTGDALEDVVLTYGGNTPSAFLATFAQVPGGGLNPPLSLPSFDLPEAVEVADVDGDGRPDVVVTHGGWEQVGVYMQLPDGTLAAEELYPVPYASHYNPHGLAVGDIDDDGLDDVVIADYNHGLVVLRSDDRLPPSVDVTDPDGDQLYSGIPFPIEWSASDNGALEGFDVDFSADGGATFLPVPGCTALPADARACVWASPGPVTAQGVIRVTARDRSGHQASDGAPCTVVVPFVTVTAPVAGANWGIGSVQTVTWSHNLEASEQVDVELSRDLGRTWTTIGAGVPNTGRYDWKVSGATTRRALVRVTWTSQRSISDVSDAPFRIAAAFVRVTTPNSNVLWTIGSQRNISWSHNFGTQAAVRVQLTRNNGATWSVLAPSVPSSGPGTGSYAWTVTGPRSTAARIRLVWTANAAVADKSDTVFWIR